MTTLRTAISKVNWNVGKWRVCAFSHRDRRRDVVYESRSNEGTL